ncbi:MAG: hypothetical protein NDJ89_18085 [Oligoflexia bacterium]|nr:hypothetical protein [Oligoflexia bacterium]
MKYMLMTVFAIIPSLAFCETFEATCKKINPVTNQYKQTEGLETCTLKGTPYKYPLADILNLNLACGAQSEGSYADITAIRTDSSSEEKSPRLLVYCWQP